MTEKKYDEKIQELGLVLPEPAKPAGIYQPVVYCGNLAYLSGQLPRKTDGGLMTGKVGKDVDLKTAQEAARVAGLNVISVIKHRIGFNRFKRVLRLTGYVQADPGFTDISAVINGASEVLGNVLGEAGAHARTSVGVASLPQNAVVEIEVIVEVSGDSLQ